ncbi:MAG TPA: hypothetical protein VJ110_00935 [Candidatus Nanoarchaeia archaeon]|nr:hypothetical protein [Candidatus Nanoarchaeia archaeon]
MAIDTKTMGYLQLVAGVIALWGAWKGNTTLALAVIGIVLVVMGYHHTQAKGHKTF